MKFSRHVKQLVDERSQGNCELCGQAAPDGQYHHRRPRGMGGTKRIDTGSPSNALYVHQQCHTQIELNRQDSLYNGWLVRQTQDPELIPVNYRGIQVLLTVHGMITEVMPGSPFSG